MLYRDEDTVKICAEQIWIWKNQDLGACFLHIATMKHKAVSGLTASPVYEMIRFAQEIERQIVHIARKAGCFNKTNSV